MRQILSKQKQVLLFAVFLFLTTSLSLSAEDFQHDKLWSFESINAKEWSISKGHSIVPKSNHYKHGEKALRWSWKNNGSITLNSPIGFVPFNPEGEDKSIPSFAVWVYNEKPVDDHIKFVFSTDEEDNCHFEFGLNYKGWRAAWVSFERDMKGEPKSSMNRMRIESPKSVEKGALFIDHMFLCQNIDSRHHTPDIQVPFVNEGTKSHWLIQYKASKAKPDMAAPKSITEEHTLALRSIEERFQADILKKKKVSASTIESLQKKFNHYQIRRKGKQIVGLPIWFGRNAELYMPYITYAETKSFYKKNNQTARSYFDFMMSVATAYANTDDAELRWPLETMFVDLFDHMVDQGIAAGSGLGTIHHYGYNWRNYYRALFIMREVLEANDRLEEAVKGMQWFAALGEVFHKPEIDGMDMDAFNTQVMGRLASVLVMEDSPEKIQYLNCFARWIDNGLLPAPGLNDAFKIDGSAYHHANHYPAYATGGMNGAVRMVYFLSATPFQVSETAHFNLKRALLTMRFYCNFLHWPTSMSGRHPEGKGKLMPDHYAILAMAGSPNGEKELDKELGAAYLRLINGKKTKYSKLFDKQGIVAEPTPKGHISMPYASSSVHRRGDWAASVRGHSRYLWAAEHYLGANLYGRYMAHGQLQIMGGGSPVTPKSSGFVQQGWDWNRFPGTTIINLPIDGLRADILNVDQFSGYEEMLFSDEAFAGGLQSNNTNGVYAFILHEHDKYQGSLRARKSYFFFDDIIVCLGSGIENVNQDRPTETVLFQNHMTAKDESSILNGDVLEADEMDFTVSGAWMRDNKGNGYLIPKGDIFFKQGEQVSRDESSEKPTQGRFAAAVIKHGKAPKNASYHYSVLPQAEISELESRSKDCGYDVLEQSNSSHIVHNKASNETAYVFFEAATDNQFGLIQKTNIPCLAMSKQNGQELELSIANPDLALYEGPADEIYKDGKRVERSIYSRPWRPAESLETKLEIQIKGLWTSECDRFKLTHNEEGNTVLTFICKDGLSQNIVLKEKM